MSIHLEVNSIYRYTVSENGQISQRDYRVLWMSPERDSMHVIDINNKRAWPVRELCSQVETDISTGFAQLLEDDPYSTGIRPEELLNETEIAKRDKWWNIILLIKAQMLDPHGEEIYIRSERSALIDRVLDAGHSFDKGQLYEYLRRYFQGGQTLDTQVPHYQNCGTHKGPAKSVANGAAKRGTKSNGGVNVLKSDQEKIKKAVLEFYIRRKLNLTETYYEMLTKYYSRWRRDGNGKRIRIQPQEGTVLTEGQFRYWVKKLFSTNELKRRRLGDKKFNKNHRGVTGRPRLYLFGPGKVFIVDWGLLPIYLLNASRRHCIGMPILYIVVDGWTGRVVGFYLHLGTPSYEAFMMAAYIAMSDKAEFCGRFGVTITPDEWPACVPRQWHCDKGPEFASKLSERLIGKDLSKRIANETSGRPDIGNKAIVESTIDLVKNECIKDLAGAIPVDYEKGDRDPRLDAVLTRNELTQSLIRYFLGYNQTHVIKDFPLEPDMLDEGITAATPNRLWQFGLSHRAGFIRKSDPNTLRRTLLVPGKGSVTKRSLDVDALPYFSKTAIENGWHEQARERVREVDVLTDPRTPSYVYLWNDGNLEKCDLDPTYAWLSEFSRSEAIRKVKQLNADQKRIRAAGHIGRSERRAQDEVMVKEAKRAKANATMGLTKSQQLNNSAEHKREEFNAQRKEEAWDDLATVQTQNGVEPKNEETKALSDPAPVTAPQYTDTIREARDRKLQGEPQNE